MNWIFLTSGLLAAAQGAPSTSARVDGVAAVVNRHVITRSDVLKKAGPLFKLQGVEEETPPNHVKRQTIASQVLDEMVADELIQQEAGRLKIVVDDARLQHEIDDISKRNNLNDVELRQALLAQGLTYAEYRESLRGQLLRFELVGAIVRPRVKVSEDDLRSAHAQEYLHAGRDPELHLLHLLVAVGAGRDLKGRDEAKKQIQALAAEAGQGTAFSELAKKTGGKPDGYDLGFVKKGTLLPELEKAAFVLKSGEISPIIETRLGFHVLKLVERRDPGAVAFEEVRKELQEKVFQKKVEEEFGRWVKELREKSHIISHFAL